MGLQADAPVRGSLALGQLKGLEKGRTADLRLFYESDIDSGLLWWDRVEAYPLFGWINVLSGHGVMPDYLKYGESPLTATTALRRFTTER